MHRHSAPLRRDRYSSRSQAATARNRTPFRRLLHETLEQRTVLDAAGLLTLPPQHYLFNTGGFLSAPAEGNAVDIARAYLADHAQDLGLTPADLEGAKITSQYVTEETQVTQIYLRQMVAGLEVDHADLNIGVTSAGEVISVGGGFVPGLGELVAAGGISLEPTLSADDAARWAAASLGLSLDANPQAMEMGEDGMSCMIVAPGLSLDDISAQLHFVPSDYGTAALSWQLIVRTPDGQHWYDLSIDAHSGHVTSQVDWYNHATYTALPIPTESPNFGPFQVVVDPHLASPTASPFGWHDTNGIPGAESTLTIGNNVDAHLDRDGNNVADAGGRPDGGPGLNFNFTFNPALSPQQNANAAVTNLFYWNNVLHDVHYAYGFTAAAGNFQTNNYGQGGLGNDAVQADAQDNAQFGSVNNANMAVPPDGVAPRMQMYEFTSTNPRRDSDMDPGIIIHEYGHGVSVRLTGGPANSGSLGALQSAGMGEGWGDWWSLMLTQRTAGETTTPRGMGTYVLGQPTTGPGARQFRYDFDITNQSFETFANFPFNTEVHNVGTRWAATLWDLNHLLIQKYGFEPNLYNSTSPAGNIKALHLVMNSLKFQPANPSFLNARDAILTADNVLYGGANQLEIWTAFARRGLGYGAFTPSANSSSLTTSFALPPQLQGLQATSSTPANGAVVTTAATNFVINFNNPVAIASVQPSDLRVNGIPATGASLTNNNQTVIFTYVNSPLITQGPQTMTIAANSIVRAGDNDGVNAFFANFRYDATPLNVVATAPPPNGVFTLSGSLTYDVTFNEPVDPASVQPSDLALSGVPGTTVSSAVVQPGNRTVRFTITGATTEGTLTTSIAAGAINDAFGNPGGAFTASYQTDIGAIPYPVPLEPLPPAGSLIYDPTASGVINVAADTDSFVLTLDPGQTISVVADPVGTLSTILLGGVGNGAGTAAGRLITLNPATGAGTIVADPVTPGGITGLDYDAALGVLFGTTMQSVGNVSTLVRINPLTGALLETVGVIADALGPMSIGDLAIQPGTGVLYGIRSNADQAGLGGRLYTIDKETGAATLVGNANSGSGGGIAFASDGSLYQTAHSAAAGGFTSLNRLNPTNAARISTVAVPSYFDGLAIRPSDGVFFAATGGSSEQIFTIDHTTGAATLVGTTGVGSTSDLAFVQTGGSLAPVIELRNPAGEVIAATSAGAGLKALLQTAEVAAGGQYTISVHGGGGTSGGYNLKVTLNAAIEEEGLLASASNDTLATAQDLSGSFLDLNPQSGVADRGAVAGHTVIDDSAVNLIVNGDFETGNFNGWTVSLTGRNGWQINNGSQEPVSPATPLAPIGGTFDAFSDSTGPGLRTLTQAFIVPADVTRATLSWSDRIQNFANAFQDPTHEFRVLLTTTTGGVLQTVYSTNPGDSLIQVGPNARSFDVTSALQGRAGQTLQLRFEEQDSLFYFNVTLDNIHLDVQTGPAPRDDDFYALQLAAGQSVQLALALPGFQPSGLSFAPNRTDFTTPGLPGQSGVIPLDVIYRDLNGDGKLDMVSANGGQVGGPNSAGSVAVRLGNGDGTFAAPTVMATNGIFTRFLDTGDVNGDGKLDIVTTNANSNSVSLFVGNGNGTFAPPLTYNVASSPLGVTVSDLNADGRADVVVPHSTGTVGVLLGQANGTLGPFSQFTVGGSGPITTAVGDVNGDGRPDVVTANFSSSSMSVLLGNGAGGLGAPTVLGGQGANPWGIALADLNSDGRLDVITGNQGSGNIAVRLGSAPTALFGAPTFFSTGGNGPRTVSLGDVNRDGKLDVAVPNIGSATVSVLVGNGSGGFGAPLVFSTGLNPNSATLADVNGDGFDDLSTANAGSNGIGSVSLRLNATAAVQVQLQDAAGNVVASGQAGSTNYDVGLTYTATVGGVYYVRVFGNTESDYHLIATRSAAFDTEPNNSQATAQNLDGLEGALGAISGNAGSELLATGNLGNQLIRIDTSNGLATLIGPFGTLQTFAAAFTPDGTLWTIIDGPIAGSARLATVDTATGAATPIGGGNWTGSPVIALEADAAGNLYGASYSGGLYHVNKTTGQMTLIGQTGFFNIMDLAFDQAGVLWGLDGANVLFQINTATGQGTFRSVISGTNGTVMGLMVDPLDNAMYATTYNPSSRLYRVNPTNGTVTPVGTGVGIPYAHGGDFRLLSDMDVYEVTASTGSVLVFQTRTPADGPDETVNGLNPRIELLDPSGAVVATGTVLADGRNERIEYTALASGAYRVRVSAEDSTAGEYYLSRNISPTLRDVVVTSSIAEGGTARLSGHVVDPDPADSHTVVIQWGPGEGSTTIELPAGVANFTASHVYRDDNPSLTPSDVYPLSMTVTDSAGDGSTDTFTTQPVMSNLVVNGDFETGTFAGWDIPVTGGSWQINNGSLDPNGPALSLPPIAGDFDAVSIQSGPGLRIISEPIVVPANITSATLRWVDRIRNYAGQFVDPGQEFRVLILDEAGNTLLEVFSTDPNDPPQQIGPNLRSFDVTSLLQSLGGQTIRLSFQEQDSLSFFNVTVDDIQLLITTTDVAPKLPPSVVVSNVAPTIGAVVLSANSIDEGQTVEVTGTFTDPAIGIATEAFSGSAAWSDGVMTPLVIDPATGMFSTSRSFSDDDPADTFSVTITIADDDSGSGSAVSPVLTVNNVAPKIGSILLSASAIEEGKSVSVTGTFTDPALGIATETFTGIATWSDGFATPLVIDPTTGAFSTSRSFPDDNPTFTPADSFTVAITIADDDNGSDTAVSSMLAVNNVAPTIGNVVLNDSDLQEGQSVSVTGTFTDPAFGIATETFTGLANWSDGVTTPLMIDPTTGTFSISRSFPDDAPPGTSADTYTVVITIADDDGGSGSAISPVLTVNNVAPTIGSVLFSTSAIDEGQSVSVSGTFTDQAIGVSTESFTGTAAWSDGVVTPLVIDPTTGTFSTSRSFPDDGPSGTPADTFTATITITDDDGGSDSAVSPVLTVSNVAPQIDALTSDAPLAAPAAVGQIVGVSASFTDLGTFDSHVALIDWGDGSSSPATVAAGLVSASHVYTMGGIYTVTLTLVDDDTGSDVAATQAYISGAGVVDGQLQIIGTNGDDDIHVNRFGSGDKAGYRVHASFLATNSSFIDIPAAGVSSLLVMLLDGDDAAQLAGNVWLPAVLDGGNGNDHLNGGGGPTVLLGGDGDDFLQGSNANDLLIGGAGADSLNGGPGEDILIGGSTSFGADAKSLLALLGEWNSSRSLTERQANLRVASGPILAGTDYKLLKGTSVFDDGDADTLNGASGVDWFFYQLGEDELRGDKGELRN